MEIVINGTAHTVPADGKLNLSFDIKIIPIKPIKKPRKTVYAPVRNGNQIAVEHYYMDSFSTVGVEYHIVRIGERYTCTCEDHQNRQRNCKHIDAIIDDPDLYRTSVVS